MNLRLINPRYWWFWWRHRKFYKVVDRTLRHGSTTLDPSECLSVKHFCRDYMNMKKEAKP